MAAKQVKSRQRVADHGAAKGVFNHGAVPLVA